MIESKLRKIWKSHSPRCHKNTFPEVFHIKLGFLHLVLNVPNEAKGIIRSSHQENGKKNRDSNLSSIKLYISFATSLKKE